MSLKDNKAAYRVVVKGIIADSENRILFVRERSDTWDLPGGGLEHGEEVKRALERLGTTSFIFNNCFYSNPQMGLIKNKVVTKILSYRELNFDRAINIDENLKFFFTNGKIKEIIEEEVEKSKDKFSCLKGTLR